MEVINYSNLRENLKQVLDSVAEDETQYIVNRGESSAVIMSLDEYNSWKETLYLMSTPSNAERLMKAVKRDQQGKYIKKTLIDE
jgi:antitoxin YefM